jgi:hypothetical protein
LRSGSAYAQSAVRPVIIVEPPSSKPLPTPPNVLPIWPSRPAPTERYSKQSPSLGLVSYRHPVEYDHGDVLAIVRTDSEHIA